MLGYLETEVAIMMGVLRANALCQPSCSLQSFRPITRTRMLDTRVNQLKVYCVLVS